MRWPNIVLGVALAFAIEVVVTATSLIAPGSDALYGAPLPVGRAEYSPQSGSAQTTFAAEAFIANVAVSAVTIVAAFLLARRVGLVLGIVMPWLWFGAALALIRASVPLLFFPFGPGSGDVWAAFGSGLWANLMFWSVAGAIVPTAVTWLRATPRTSAH